MPKQFSKQETFDIVARALAAQGRKSVTVTDDGPRCQYRGDEDCRCAAGHLIPDPAYLPAMEGLTVVTGYDEDEEVTLAGEVVYAEGHDLQIVADLQNAHDSAVTGAPWLADWTDRMRRLAGAQGLSTAALDEALAARVGGEA